MRGRPMHAELLGLTSLADTPLYLALKSTVAKARSGATIARPPAKPCPTVNAAHLIITEMALAHL